MNESKERIPHEEGIILKTFSLCSFLEEKGARFYSVQRFKNIVASHIIPL